MKPLQTTLVLLLALTTLAGCSRTEKINPQRKDLIDVVFASGTIYMEKEQCIISQVEGMLFESFVSEGDSVTPKQLLFTLHNTFQQAVTHSAAAAYQQAESNRHDNAPVWQKLNQQQTQLYSQLRNDSIQFQRYKTLYASRAVSKVELDKMELAYLNRKAEIKAFESSMEETRNLLELERMNAKANLLTQQNNNEQYRIVSAYPGLVLDVAKIPGEYVKRGEILAQIGSGMHLAKLLIAESDIDKIKLGQSVYIELNTNKEHSYPANISNIHPAFDASEQSFVAEATFTGPHPALRAGTPLQANIVVGESRQALVIPSSFLLPNKHVKLAGSKEERSVTTGIATPEWIEIKAGLTEKDLLIRKKDGSKKKS
jgi:multidrug efflux pump subunit AcrA (membrane-fusion protein)